MKFWTVLYRSLYFMLCGIVICWIALLFGFLPNEPLEPNQATGNIVPWNNHGAIHYITELENFLLHWMVPIAFLIMIGMYQMKLRIKGEIPRQDDDGSRL